MGKGRKNFYAVRVGRSTGIYSTWEECEAQVKGHSGAVYKGFSTVSEASSFVQGSGGYSGGTRSSYGGGRGGTRSSYGGGNGGYSGGTRSSYGGGTSSYYGQGTSSYQPSYQNSGYTPSYSSSARQRYSGNFTSYRSGRKYHSNQTKFLESLPETSGGSGGSSSSRPVVYSDGCCYNNGFRGACGGVGVYWGHGSSHNVSEKLEGNQTNQRAELVSACRALETAIQQGHSSVEVRTDSTYTIKAVTEWIRKWKANGWRTVNNEDVKNKEDIQRLDGLCQDINVKWTHVRGHVGVPGNEAADQLAKAGSQMSS